MYGDHKIGRSREMEREREAVYSETATVFIAPPMGPTVCPGKHL
jgi:hypothetical protein